MKTDMAKKLGQATWEYVNEQSQILFFVLASDGRILETNRFAESMTGCRPGQKKFQDLVLDFHDSFSLDRLTKEPAIEHLLNIKMGSRLPQSFYFRFMTMAPFILAFGRLDAEELESMRKEMLNMNQELNNMTRTLQKKNTQLRQLNQEKNQFLGMAAHDLRKPIGLILTYSEFLMEEISICMNTEQRDFLTTIQNSSLFMKKLVDDFLDVAAIEAGVFDLDLEPVDVISLLEKSLKPNRLQAAKKGIELQIIAPNACPQVPLDASKIEQALTNLVSNAIEHSEPGSTVTITLIYDSEYLVFEVRDQGSGIIPEDMDKLFKPFKKTKAEKTSGEKSTGLGLVIARKIIMAHRGEIQVHSQPGLGTTIRFTLPLKD